MTCESSGSFEPLIWDPVPGEALARICRRGVRRAPVRALRHLVFGTEVPWSSARTGLNGERTTGRSLERFVRDSRAVWAVAHNLRVDTREVDHLVIGQRGIFVVNTKCTSSPRDVRVTGDHVPAYGTGKDVLPQLRAQVAAVDRALTRILGEPPPVAPQGVVVTVRARLHVVEQPADCTVVTVEELPVWLRRQPKRLSPRQRDDLLRAIGPLRVWGTPPRVLDVTGAG